jgi:endonuclease YncB( thermonuclease family)
MMVRLLLAMMLLFAATAHADPIASQDIYIIDGDTIAVHGKTIRLVGFDAPELGGRAQCGIERMLAARATSRLRRSSASVPISIYSWSIVAAGPEPKGRDGAITDAPADT